MLVDLNFDSAKDICSQRQYRFLFGEPHHEAKAPAAVAKPARRSLSFPSKPCSAHLLGLSFTCMPPWQMHAESQALRCTAASAPRLSTWAPYPNAHQQWLPLRTRVSPLPRAGGSMGRRQLRRGRFWEAFHALTPPVHRARRSTRNGCTRPCRRALGGGR
jgi:hypothetical protein